ncbi:MAG TPA: hypothetical protein VIS94_02165 [Desulfomonilia bacterium]
MRKRVIIYTIILITGIFISCGGGGGGGGSDAGGESGRKYTLTASVVGGNGSVTPASGTYDEGAVVSLNASPAAGYQVKAWSGTDDDTSKNNTNTVTMNANRTVTVEFQSVNAGNISREQAQDVLYAAYAGIGYNTVKSDTDDDEALYNIMFDSLNSLMGNFVNEIFLKQLTIPIILNMVINEVTFKYTPAPAGISSAEMTVKIGNVDVAEVMVTGKFAFDFNSKMKVKFNSDGYAYDGVVYKGSATDFEAEMSGSLKGEGMNTSGRKITPNFDTVNISAHNTLSAGYSGYSVNYGEWNISYALKDDTYNLYIAPIIGEALKPGDYIDIRNYKLDGNFDINKNGMHSYYMNVQYGQLDLDFNYGGGKFIALTGDVSVPSLGGQKVSVNSAGTEMLTGNILNLISNIILGQVNINDFIRRNDNGAWISGKLKIKPVNSEITATFNNDGSVQFPDGPAVANWQDALDPVK